MIRSMTAFARLDGQGHWGKAIWELKSVNHRYLEIAPRLPEDLRGLEEDVRKRIGQSLKRGKIDCTLRYEAATEISQGLEIDETYVKQLDAALRQVSGLITKPAPVNILDVLRWPGVLKAKQVNVEGIHTPLIELLDEALKILVENRQREGEALRKQIKERCLSIAEQVTLQRQRVPEILIALQERLLTRIKEFSTEYDESRVEQEMVMMAQKMDVAEELDRLDSHVQEVLRIIDLPKPNGRRLDFLMQEMNREANTLASKSTHIDTTGGAIELKVLIEQIREQVQNVE